MRKNGVVMWAILIGVLIFGAYTVFSEISERRIAVPLARITGYDLIALHDVQAARGINYAGWSSSTNALGTTFSLTADPAFSAYTTGMVVTWFATTGSGENPYANVNSLGWKQLKKASDFTAFSAGQILTNQPIIMVYDGTVFKVIGE